MENFSEKLIMALDFARKEARNNNYSYIGSEHLLIGLASVQESVACQVLKTNGITKEKILDIITGGTLEKKLPVKKLEYSIRAKELLEEAGKEAVRCKQNIIGTQHLLMAILKDLNCCANNIIIKKNGDIRKLYIDVLYAIGEDPAKFNESIKNSNTNMDNTPTLNKYGKDYTALAYEGKLEPVIGRKEEIERMIQILCRKSKNNPCLIGEAGVGKTAIVEGLAKKLVINDVPEQISGKRLISIELSGMVAGTKYRGEFEDRIQNVIKEVSQNGNIILFIDEIHTIIGAGGAEGSLDASNILKPSLSRGEIQLIGATTIDEYRKHIEKDPALERRFQQIEVKEPSVNDTINMLEGIAYRYESHHNVLISKEAIEAAVTLSERYINDRFLPDKAIDLIDEASSKVNLTKNVFPKNLVKAANEVENMELQREEAIKEDKWDEYEKITKLIELKKKNIMRQQEKWEESKATNKITITKKDIAELISKWTRIPVDKIEKKESERLLSLEKILHERVIGQEKAINSIAKAIRRGRSGIKEPNRPIGSFLFLGPTGVGKTELSKALTEAVFGNKDSLIRVDMSEFMEKHSASKLIGSPPGYVGYDEGGQLSEKVRRNPYSVVLFDEIEKADPDIFNILLQVLDEGTLTDAHGKKIDFKNTIIIMTSNVGANKIVEPKSLGFNTGDTKTLEYENMKSKVLEEMKQVFKPEFINRIDEIVVFHPLSMQDVTKIVGILLKELSDRLKKQLNIQLVVMPNVKELIAKEGFDKKYGARPLKREIQTKIEDEIAMLLLNETVSSGDKVILSIKNNKINITSKNIKNEL